MGKGLSHKLVEVLEAGATSFCAAEGAEGRAFWGARYAAMGARLKVGTNEPPMIMGLNCEGWGKVSYGRF